MAEQTTCKGCNKPIEASDNGLDLCPECREALAQTSFPLWIWLALIGIIVLLTFSLSQFPRALKAGIAYDRGQKAFKTQQYERAINQYMLAYKQYPDSTITTARLAIALYKGGYDAEAIAFIKKLSGREASEALVLEINAIMKAIDEKYFNEEQK